MKLRITSIFTKIVLWFLVMVAISLVGLMATSLFLSARFTGRETNSTRLNTIFLDDARRAYEEGGRVELEAYLKRLDAYSGLEHFLTDGRGIDLISGEDRSDMRRARRPMVYRVLPPWFLSTASRSFACAASDDRRYRLINVLPLVLGLDFGNRSNTSSGCPSLIGISCYLLAVHLASPLRSLRKVVERFGRGELGIRYHLARQDEIGELARSFNRMADQIAILLSAERRLLQDVSHELALAAGTAGVRSRAGQNQRRPRGRRSAVFARKPIVSINWSMSCSSSLVPKAIRLRTTSRRSHWRI